MQKPELPTKYYLDHFMEMLSTITRVHGFLLEDNHRKFISQFQEFSEDAKCLYIRMANRKGKIFDQVSLLYEEIENLSDAWEELKRENFVREAGANDEALLIQWMKKDQLKRILTRADISFKKSAGKSELLESLKKNYLLVKLDEEYRGMIIHESYHTLHYLLYLMFGKIQENLILYTLRDLGIRKSNSNNGLKAKFQSIEEARSLYFYQTLRMNQKKDLLNVEHSDIQKWPAAETEEAKGIKEKVLLHLAETLKPENPLGALELFKLCEAYPATEKRARLLWDLELKEECQQELIRLMDNPSCDEEILFAEDFLARKFEKKRLSILTETLRNAKTIEIDDSFFRHPEFGVVEHFKLKGYRGFFSENYLFYALFGVVFHEELTHQDLHVHSEFDRIPTDLMGKAFYQNNKEAIEAKLYSVAGWNWDEVLERDYSKAEFFILDEDGKEILSAFLKATPAHCLVYMLRYLAENFFERNSGFPDIFVVVDGQVHFYEIKAEGDSLKRSQLKQMRELEKAGFKVEVLNVKYKYNPETVYVVVDIETTGHLSPFNRITEVAAVKMKGDQVIDRYQSLINPRRSIPRDIQALTGITNEMVANAPFFEDVADALDEFTKEAIFVAHNVGFDYNFIQKEFERLERKFVRPYICTKQGMKKHYPDQPSYSLKNLTNAFSISLTQHHRALSDAEAASGLLQLINAKRSLLVP